MPDALRLKIHIGYKTIHGIVGGEIAPDTAASSYIEIRDKNGACTLALEATEAELIALKIMVDAAIKRLRLINRVNDPAKALEQ